MLLDKLNWRYATKKMNPSKTVSKDKLDRIIEAVRLAPTSSGLQPFEIIVVKNPEVRAKLRDAAFDQAQVTDGTAVLVFAAWDNYTEARIDDVVADLEAARGGANEAISGYYSKLKDTYLPRDANVNFEHAARQAYIALGIALTAAAFEEVDATPMEGFDPPKFDEILGLSGRGLRSVVAIAVGYRAAEGDWLAHAPKVRRALAKFATTVE
jgi:nitroreductase/dihydropteridine reductase